MENLIEIAQDQILHELDIDKVAGFQESILQLMENGRGEEIMRLQAELRFRLK